MKSRGSGIRDGGSVPVVGGGGGCSGFNEVVAIRDEDRVVTAFLGMEEGDRGDGVEEEEGVKGGRIGRVKGSRRASTAIGLSLQGDSTPALGRYRQT